MKRLAQLLCPDLLRALDALDAGAREQNVAQLAYDARRVGGPALFAAWRGQRADGHDHLAEAQRRGALCALVQRPVAGIAIPQLVCADPRRALARAARAFYDAPDAELTLVAITGTNGKTTCVQLLASVLAAWRGTSASMGTLGTRLYYGAPDANAAAQPVAEPPSLTTAEGPELVAELRALVDGGCRAVALEASSIALDQGRLDGLYCDAVAWTNTTQDHLDYHGTFAAYAAAKHRLAGERLKDGGFAVANAEDAAQLPRDGWGAGGHALRFATSPAAGADGRPAEVYPLRGGAGRDGIALEVHTPRGPLALTSPLFGAFNVENLLLVVAVAEALGVPHGAVRAGVAALTGVRGRLERVEAPPGTTAPLVLVDYAHTPDALARVLATVRPLTAGKVWCLFGCGGERDAGKRPRMGDAVARGADFVVVTNDNPRGESPEAIARAVVDGLTAAGASPRASVAELPNHTGPGACFTVALDRAAAIADAVAAASPGDTVVVAGKGHETMQVSGNVRLPFDDADHARRALARRAQGPA